MAAGEVQKKSGQQQLFGSPSEIRTGHRMPVNLHQSIENSRNITELGHHNKRKGLTDIAAVNK